MNSNTLAAVVEALGHLGYQPGAASPTAERIDREACAESECPACGRLGLEFRPFRRGRSYRGLAVCTACNHVEEV